MSTITGQEQGVSVWTLDPAHTQIEFSVKHMMFTTVRGIFSEATGTIELNETDPSQSRVEVVLQAASLDTRVEARDQHLRSADFFDVEGHPTLTFRSKQVQGSPTQPGDSFRLVGDLTIRGETREVVLEGEYEGRGRDPWGNEKIGFTASTKIDRRDFGLTWNQALEAGGVLVSNDVKIELAVQGTAA